MFKIYLAMPISGQSWKSVTDYIAETTEILSQAGYQVLSPMKGKDYLRTEVKLRAEGYKQPLSQNHAIFERDKWMVAQSDLLYCNLTKTNGMTSIGSMMELAWASMLGKHTIISLPVENIHRHAFVLEAADVIYETHEEALNYLINQLIA